MGFSVENAKIVAVFKAASKLYAMRLSFYRKSNLPFLCLLLCVGAGFAQTPFRTGINFPFHLPDAVSIHQYLALMEQSGAKATRQMTYADVHWRHVEPADNQWNFTRSDSAFLHPFDITPIGTLYSMMGNDTIGMQTPWLACSNPFNCYWDPAGDSIYAKDYVFQVVNRYKHATKYWELGNEIEHVLPPAGLPTLQAKRNFLMHNYRWIKTADPEAKVILPGLLGTCCTYPMSNSFAWLRGLLSLGGGSFFDIMNYHDYNAWWTLPAHYDSIQTILQQYGLQKPVWITETSVSSFNISPITPRYSSADEQAADVWRRICLLWAKGAEVVLWHSGWSNGNLSSWGEFGILSSNGLKKKSFHAYKLLNEKIARFSAVQWLSAGEVTDNNNAGGNGAWAIRFVVDGAQKWVLWSPNNQPYTLTGIHAPIVKVTHVVPIQLLQAGDSAVFHTYTLSADAGACLFNSLSSLPVLVEEVAVSHLAEPSPVGYAHIYPNPASTSFTAAINLYDATSVFIDILDAMGRSVHRVRSGRLSPGSHELDIELPGLSSGVYYCKVFLGERIIIKKLVVGY